MKVTKCPTCGGTKLHKVIFGGFPFKLCEIPTCSTLFGWWDWLIPVLSYFTDGNMYAFMEYEGSYHKALWYWLTHDIEGGDRG